MDPISHRGVFSALTIVALWLASLVALLAVPFDPVLVLPGVLWMTFLNTGLFITAHDAMHGTVSPKNRWLNDALGSLAVGLYALFSYRKLRLKHAQHHEHPGQPGADPDFHDGKRRGFLPWYFHFALNYVGIWQVVGMAVVFNLLAHLVGVAEPNLIVFWVAPSLLSTLQLFTFGTDLPHRGEHPADDAHRARSLDVPTWLSFLTCYHFGYHHEHHDNPGIPWWRLPAARARR